MRLALICLVALCAFWMPSRDAMAAQSYDSCTGYVTSLPATISSQGTWCLNKDLSTSIQEGAAITINTNNVTLDCNGFKVGGLAAGIGTQAVGVMASQRSNTTVRNCNVRGFWIGIGIDYNAGDIAAPTGNVVESSRVDGSTRIGIVMSGDASVVRDNIVTNTGGTPTGENPVAIQTHWNVDVLDNLIDGVAPTEGTMAQSYGILAWSNTGGVIRGNRLRAITANENYISNGIAVTYNSDVVIDDNVIHGVVTPISCSGSAQITDTNIAVGAQIGGCPN